MLAVETGMGAWTTDGIKERERFGSWLEAVSQRVFNISAAAAISSFSGRITTKTLGSLRFALGETTACEFVRTKNDINSAPAEHYTIYLQVRGQTHMVQSDDSFLFQCNDIFIYDGRQPFHQKLFEGASRALAVVPRRMIEWRLPWVRGRSLCKLDSSSRYGDLARRHIVHVARNEVSEREAILLTENLCNLLALAGTTNPVKQLPAEVQLEALLTFSRQTLHDPELSPQLVADKFGISVRTLHLRFQALGKSFGSWLLESRLDAVGKALKDPRQCSRSISEIAYGCGFNDLSHFNRTFRARFEMTPGEWRFDA